MNHNTLLKLANEFEEAAESQVLPRLEYLNEQTKSFDDSDAPPVSMERPTGKDENYYQSQMLQEAFNQKQEELVNDVVAKFSSDFEVMLTDQGPDMDNSIYCGFSIELHGDSPVKEMEYLAAKIFKEVKQLSPHTKITEAYAIDGGYVFVLDIEDPENLNNI